jgi:hypothetical protein
LIDASSLRNAALITGAALIVAAVSSAHAVAKAGDSRPIEPCAWDPRFVSAEAKPLPASAFKGIDRSLAIRQIVQRLGPAKYDVGSGLHVLQWPVSDGRLFSVSVADACSKPMAAGFLRPLIRPEGPPGTPPVR